MSIMKKFSAAKYAAMAYLVTAAFAAQAQSGFSNPGNLTGPTVGQISQNLNSSMAGVASVVEGVLYFLGVVFLLIGILAVRKYQKSDGRDGSVGAIIGAFVLSAASFAAPTLAGGAIASVFGSNATTVNAPRSGPMYTP